MKKIISTLLVLSVFTILTGCTEEKIETQNEATKVNEDSTTIDNNINNNELKMNESKILPPTQSEVDAIKGQDKTVVMQTNMGKIEIKLFTEKAPLTCANFVKLAEAGYYDGLIFHRVIKNFMIQAGDPLGNGTGGPGYIIQDEFDEEYSNLPGTLAMANSGPNSGGSQFFINLKDNTYLDWNKEPLDYKHPVFGEVVEGMDVVMKIGDVQTARGDRPLADVIMEKVTIE